MEGLINYHGRIYVGYQWLQDNYYIPEGSIFNWINRIEDIDGLVFYKQNGLGYINYDYIPAQTRSKLPSKNELGRMAREMSYDMEADKATKYLEPRVKNRFPYYFNKFDKMKLNCLPSQIPGFARRAAAIETILEYYTTHEGAKIPLFSRVFKNLVPGVNAIPTREHFCRLMKKAKTEGIEAVTFDKRTLNLHMNHTGKKFNALHQYIVFTLMSNGKAYKMNQLMPIIRTKCEELGQKVPSYGWVKWYCRKTEVKNALKADRYGLETWIKEDQPYITLIPALHPGDQWQMDGWELPFFCKKEIPGQPTEYFLRYTIYAVMDANTRKYVGYSIAETENTDMILTAMERAVKETGIIPFEIVVDNHSFNKTKEAGNLIEELKALGLNWTVDSNPRRKALLERSFKRFAENQLKWYPGYTGQGIKTKDKDGRPAPEYLDKAAQHKNQLTYSQLCTIVAQAVIDYNNMPLVAEKLSPDENYKARELNKAISIDEYRRLALFIRKSEGTVKNGQITIKRSGTNYEFQLNSVMAGQLNGKNVTIRYESLDELYLYDIVTDKPICTVKPKSIVHSALANQTDQDIERLNKGKGRIEGIKARNRHLKEDLTKQACIIHPAAYEALDPRKTVKESYNSLKRQYYALPYLSQLNVNPSEMRPLPEIDETSDESLLTTTKHANAFTSNIKTAIYKETYTDNE
jgi:hypothetical protein